MRTLFISYRRAEQDDADELRRDLAGRIRVTSHTVTPAAAATWREECQRLIRSADAVVCIVGDQTAESPNVDWELETAFRIDRPVLAVRAGESVDPELPEPLADHRCSLLEPDDLRLRLEALAYERAG